MLNGRILLGDDYHFHQNRIEGLAASIKNGLFMPKVNYFFIGGYGYASSLFYSDFYIYFPALLRSLGLSLTASFICFMIAVNFITFSVTYLSGRLMKLSTKTSYLFSLLYTLAVYRLQDMINRQAVGELLAMMFFPLILAGLFLLKSKEWEKWYVLAIGMVGVGLAHVISLEMMTLFVLFYVLFNWKVFLTKKGLLSLVKAAGLSFLLLAHYLLPIIEQMIHTTFQVTTQPLAYMSDRSYPLTDLIKNSLTNEVFHRSTANLGNILFLGLIVYVLTIWRKTSRNKDLIILCCLFLFMITTLFPWDLLTETPLNVIQFPWRFLTILSMLTAFIISDDSLQVFKRFPKALPILCLLIVFNVGLYEWSSVSTSPKRYVPYETYNQTNSYYIGAGHEYLPEQTNYADILDSKSRPLAYNDEKILLDSVDKEFSTIDFRYETQKNVKTSVIVPFIYYYGYKAKVESNGKQKIIPAEIDEKTGLVKLLLSGKGKVEIFYQSTALQKASLFISVLTLIIGLYWAFIWKRKAHSSF